MITRSLARLDNRTTDPIAMTALHIRLAGVDELDLIAPMFDAYRQFYEQPADLNLARRFIAERLQRGESEILLATDDGEQALGFCQLYPTFCSVAAAPIYTLYDLFVMPQARRLGVGRALLLAAEARAAQTGRVRLDLSTAKTNQTAQSVYESLGWVRDNEFYTYSRDIPPA